MPEKTTNEAAGEAADQVELENILAGYLRAVETGNPPNEADFLQRHPELAPDLKSFFENRRQMEQVAGPLRAAGDATRPGTRHKRIQYLGDYELLDEIGCGGMGVIFKARQTSLQRMVAVKMVLDDRLPTAEDRQRFRIEAEAAASLEHANILPIYEVGEYEGQQYFSMKLVEGASLSQRLASGSLPVREAASVMITVAHAVQFAHEHGILHRDLKPANILIDAGGSPFVTDFGLAKRVENESDLTHTGAVLGTPSYMAPEQAAGRGRSVTTATDVYGLGAILYACLTGRAPFQAENVVQTLKDVMEREPVHPCVFNKTIDRDLETICLKCLEKEPSSRYASAEALGRDLERYIAGEPVTARPVGTTARIWRWCRRKPVVAGLSVVCGLAIAATIAVLIYSRIAAAAAIGQLTIEQRKTLDALAQKTSALGEKTEALNRVVVEELKARDALAEKSAALKRERITAYANTLTLARREWLEGNLARAVELLDSCQVDLRHWEWFYLHRICEPVSLYTASPSAILSNGNRLPITYDGKTLHLYHAATDAADELVDTNASTGAVTPKFGALIQPQVGVSGDGQVILSGRSRTEVLAHTSYLELHAAQSGESLFKAELPNFSLDCIAVNRDGTFWAASGSVWQPGAKSTGDWEVRVWNRESPDKPLTLPAKLHSARTLVFSPDATRLLTSHMTGFELWETASFKQIAEHDIPWTGSPNSGMGVLPCFRWDGTQFASGNGDLMVCYDSATGDQIRAFHLGKAPVSAIAFGAGDQKLAYGTVHGNVVLLDLQTGKEDVSLRLPQAIRQLDFSPDGTRLITLDSKDQLRIWDVSASPESDTIPSQAGHDFTACIDPAGRLVAAVSDHNTVRVWDIATKQLKRELTNSTAEIYDIAFSAAGAQLAAAGHDGVTVWNLETGAVLYHFADADGVPFGFATRVEFARRGSWLVAAHGRGATIWDLATGTEVRSFRPPNAGEWLSSACLTADASRLATCGQQGVLQLWDIATGRELFKVEAENTLYTLTFSPDEKQIVACGLDNDILIVDAGTGEEVRRLSGHTDGANTVAFSHDGKRLVSAGRDGVLKIWEAETGLELLSIQGNDRTIYSAAFSPDARRLITTEIDVLRIWDAGTIPEVASAEPLNVTPPKELHPDATRNSSK